MDGTFMLSLLFLEALIIRILTRINSHGHNARTQTVIVRIGLNWKPAQRNETGFPGV